MKNAKSVAIIGAGFTGLTAAYELVKLGFTVTVIEKNKETGGLAGGFTIEGHPLEQAYHHLFKTDTDILELISELGLEKELGWYESKVAMAAPIQNSKFRIQKDDKAGGQIIKLFPFNGAVDLLKYSPLSFFDRLRAGLVTFYLQKKKNWHSFKKQTAMKWMEKWAGRGVTEKIWGMLLKGKFSEYSNRISMAWLWARIHIRANSRQSIFEKEMLAYPRHGFMSITDKLVQKIHELDKDSKILLNTTIESITYENGKPVISINGKKQTFDALLSTIPTKSLKFLLDEKNAAILNGSANSSVDYLSAVVLAFSSNQSVSQFYWHTITDPNAPFLVFLQHTNLVPSEWYRNKHVYYVGAYVPQKSEYMKMSADEISSLWFKYLKQIFPAFDVKQISELKAFQFTHAQHVVTTDYESKIPPYRLHLPTTYQSNFAQIYPEDRGTNYAVREGKKIAAMIATDLLETEK